MKPNLQSTRSTRRMNWLARPHGLSARLVYVLAFLLAIGAPMRAVILEAAPAFGKSVATAFAAGTSSATSTTQLPDPELIQVCSYNQEKCEPWPPPPLLNLDQGVFGASSAQKTSLRNLEAQAIANIISDRGLTAADSIAVQTWGRSEALGQLYLLLMAAIVEDSRTTDQQNAVDWLAGIMKQKAIASADNAGREYVNWAGLNVLAFETLLASNPTQSALTEFLNDMPQLDGYCNYTPPTPYSSDYSAASHPICLSQGLICQGATFGLGCFPPTPSYDQFVKYGQARATYAFLNSAQFSRAAANHAKVVGLALSTAAAVAAGSLGAAAAVTTAATIASLESVGMTALSALFPFSGLASVALAGGVIAIILAAVVIAVIVGMQVIDASELPGQLAELIHDARTTTQDANDLTSTDGATTFAMIFIGATLPEPDFRACDNSNPGLPPGVTLLASSGILVFSTTPCLNPSAVPPPAASDPKFLVKEQGATAITETPTISYRDAETGAATTARLSKTWFVTTANDRTRQALRLEYTDWQGTTKSAWLLPKTTGGYRFVTFVPSTSLDAENCVADGKCSSSDSLEYLGSDGTNYSATVRGPSVPTGEAKFSPIKPAEGSPQSFSANNFSFTDAVGPLTYEWRFQHGGCNNGTGGCMRIPDTLGPLVPSYGDAVSGESVTHTWKLAGTFLVELTAIDSRGLKGSKAFPVTVENVPPTLLVAGECDPLDFSTIGFCNPRTRNLGESVTMSGLFDDVGTGTYNRLTISWGDGSADSKCINPPGSPFCFNVIVAGQPDPLQLGTFNDTYTFNGPHTYAAPGSYYGMVTANDPMGGSKSESFVVTIKGLPQSIDFAGMASRTYGDSPFAISATGGASGQAVSFSVTGARSVCAVSPGSGGATVSLLSGGTCTIMATQAGAGNYDAATPVTRSFTINPAPLNVTASNATISYGAALPAITPSYEGLVNGDTAASLGNYPACNIPALATLGSAAASPGSYTTSCSGAVDPRYSFTYVSGELRIDKAGTSLGLTSAPPAAVTGEPVTFMATVAENAGGDNPGGTVAFKDGATTIAGCAAQPLNAISTAATCTTTLAVGPHGVNAAYSGDENFESSAASGVTFVVGKASTSTGVSGPAGPSISGAPVTFTAAVAVVAPGAGTPTGPVTFFDGATRLGAGQLAVVGGQVQATFSTSSLAAGLHSIKASYGGSSDYVASTSAVLTHHVNTDLGRFPRLANGALNLVSANLKSAWLFAADLRGANVVDSNFTGANLTNAVLTGATLNRSNFKNANFTGANLTGVTMTGVNLVGATGLNAATLTNVVWNNTTCPNGRKSSDAGGSCIGQW